MNSKCTDETEQMRRLAWAFTVHLYDKYQHLHSWNKYVAILQSYFRTFQLKILLYLINFRSRRLKTTAATSPFEQKNRKTTRSNDLELETIEMVGIFLFIWYSDVQYASIFILWWVLRESKVALVVTGTYCELLTCISVVVPLVGGVKGTKMRFS